MTMTQWVCNRADVVTGSAMVKVPSTHHLMKKQLINGKYNDDEALQLATKNSLDDQTRTTANVTCPACNNIFELDGLNMKWKEDLVSENYIMSQGTKQCFDLDTKFDPKESVLFDTNESADDSSVEHFP